MKSCKALLLVILLVAVSGIAADKSAGAAKGAAKAWSRPYGLAGCGLGSVLLGKRSAQIFAATTNGTLYNQMFGITFGSINCVDNPNNEVASRMDRFVIANQVALAGDIARGQGETLAGLSQVMNCSDDAALGNTLQKNYSNIFSSTELAPNEITDSIITTIMNDKAVSCQNVIG